MPSRIEITPLNNIVVNKAYKEVLVENRLDTFKSFMQYANVEIAKQVIKERSTARLILDDGRNHSTFFLKRHISPSVREYLKLLTRFSWPKSAFNEWRAILRFHQAGLPTMVPVAAGEQKNSLGLVKQSFLLTKEIKDAHRLDHYLAQWLKKPLSREQIQRKRRLIQELAQLTREMHTMGLNHRDYYLCHIFIRTTEENGDFELFIIDLHRVDIRKKVGNRWVVKDLAALNFSSLELPIHATDRMRFFKLYLQKERLNEDDRILLGQILKKTKRIARHTEKMYKELKPLFYRKDANDAMADRMVRKSHEVNKYFDHITIQGAQYKGVYLRENRDLIPESFLSSPLDFIYGKEAVVIKDYNSVRVIRYQDICIKYYMRRGAKDLLKSWLGQSKGKKSFQWALALVYRFIATPEPICYLEGRGGDSFYVSRFVDSACNLVEYLRGVSQGKQKECLKALTLFLNRMFYRGVYHLDLKGTNVLVRNAGPEYRFYLTDTDEMAISWKGSHRPLYKSLLRITRTLVPYFSREELIEFVVGCLDSSPVTIGPQGIVDQAFKVEAMRRS